MTPPHWGISYWDAKQGKCVVQRTKDFISEIERSHDALDRDIVAARRAPSARRVIKDDLSSRSI